MALLSVELGCGLDFLDIDGDSWYGERTLAPRRVFDADCLREITSI